MNEQALREALRVRAEEQTFDPEVVGRAVEGGRARRRRRRRTLLAAVPVVALAVAGSAAAGLAWLPGDPPAAGDAGTVARPVQLLAQSTAPEIGMQAHLSGVLTVADYGCVAIELGDDRIIPVAWPLGWTATRGDDGRAVLYDADGRPRAREGNSVSVGGGSLDNDVAWSPIDSAHPCALGSPHVFRVSGGVEPVPLTEQDAAATSIRPLAADVVRLGPHCHGPLAAS
ncbi:hypothetical protein [Jiangella alba]|uniref:Uncharacterized protein n=1 Tax=Jiangella alba TaxID=561176 RepID=A0A1H5MS32_9ACTN|nr:hypothetical protein [Jiangella alba]SEE92169.1 hypothetical protein SAMN04488561_3383 [Jiangella alba]